MEKQVIVTLNDKDFKIETSEGLNILEGLGLLEIARDTFLHGGMKPKENIEEVQAEIVNEV